MRDGRCFNLPLSHPDVVALIAEFERIKATAISDANARLGHFKRREGAHSMKYAPSRLAKSKPLQAFLEGVFVASYRPAIAKRLGQLNRLDEKLWRICPHWPRHTRDELCAIPEAALLSVRRSGAA